MSCLRNQIMNQFDRRSHEYKAIKRYWKLIQQESRKLSHKRFYRQTWKNTIISISSCFLTFRTRRQRIFSNSLKIISIWSTLTFRLSLKPSSRIKRRLSTSFSYLIPTQNWKRLIISLNSSNEMPLVFGTLKTSKKGFSSLSTSKKKGRNSSFLDLSWLQPTTVDKELIFSV